MDGSTTIHTRHGYQIATLRPEIKLSVSMRSQLGATIQISSQPKSSKRFKREGWQKQTWRLRSHLSHVKADSGGHGRLKLW
jgi:hypothetical protein